MSRFRPETVVYEPSISKVFGIKMAILIRHLDYWGHRFAKDTNQNVVPYFCDHDELAEILGFNDAEFNDLIEEVDQTGYVKYWPTEVSTKYGAYKESTGQDEYTKDTIAWEINYNRVNKTLRDYANGRR